MARHACVACLCIIVVAGTTFAQSAAGQPVQLLHTFTRSPAFPSSPLVQAADGSLYGVTLSGIIRVSSGGQVTEAARIPSGMPTGPLVRAADGALYGTTHFGGAWGQGTVFRFDPATGDLRDVHVFQSTGEGREPIGGLVEAGGALYGVTRFGPGQEGKGTIFHVVLATGAVVTDYVFGSASPQPAGPSGPLVLAPDGRFYGPSRAVQFDGGGMYRFDPVSGSVVQVHTFGAGEPSEARALTVGLDGHLYGSGAGGAEGAGILFRYTTATGVLEPLYSLTPSNGTDGAYPGPLLAAADGHLYGVTDATSGGTPASATVFRLRAGAGGTFAYETLRVLDGPVAGSPTDAALMEASDGLIYGYAMQGGPSGTGTLFRFDPAGGAPPPDPVAFTVTHTFPPLNAWGPSAPIEAADGFLYGMTSRGAPQDQGALYRLDPGSGALTILGAVPGALGEENSSLVAGPDGFLYGTATSSNMDASPLRNRILRIDPSTGAVTVATSISLSPVSGAGRVTPGLVRTPAGRLYGQRFTTSGMSIFRFDPAADRVDDVATFWLSEGATVLTATADGQVWFAANVTSGLGETRTTLFRLNESSPSGLDAVPLSMSFFALDRLAEGGDGQLYLGASDLETPMVVRIDRASGVASPVCSLPAGSTFVQFLGAAGGALYGTVGSAVHRLFRCDPATGGVTVRMLPSGLGRLAGPLTPVGPLLYGASLGSAGLPPAELGAAGQLFRFPIAGPLPALDLDADTLPDTWETAYGLDPSAAGHGSGAADDPDGDGRTNAQELADGTHPRGFVTRLFAEGAVNAFFHTRFDLANPGLGDGALVLARFLTDAGAVVATDLVVPPRGHLAIDPATLAGLGTGSFAAIFESDTTIAVNRTMTWDASGYGSHLETGVAAPSTTWYFAEGSTSGEFALFYLLQNPQARAVEATVRYLRPSGQPPIERRYTLPADSRTTIVVDAQGPELASTDVSAVIVATAPIVAERAMYLSRPGQPFAAGHDSAGVTAPALEWFLAEGATGSFFDLFVLIANPSTADSVVDVEYLRSSGPPLTKTYVVRAQSRMTIWVDAEQLPAGSGQRPLGQGSVSTAVRVTNGVPVIVERAMWWPGPETTADYWYEAHNAAGATATATTWAIGGAEIGGTAAAHTYVLIANTAERDGTASVLLLGDDALLLTEPIALPAKSRTTVDLGAAFPAASAGFYGVLVLSTGVAPAPIVVEQATYASPNGVLWSRGGNALAAPLP